MQGCEGCKGRVCMHITAWVAIGLPLGIIWLIVQVEAGG